MDFAEWRTYNPQLGQWMSEDPIGFAGGDANIRRYVGNDVTNTIDPSGLWADPPPPGQKQPFTLPGGTPGLILDGPYKDSVRILPNRRGTIYDPEVIESLKPEGVEVPRQQNIIHNDARTPQTPPTIRVVNPQDVKRGYEYPRPKDEVTSEDVGKFIIGLTPIGTAGEAIDAFWNHNYWRGVGKTAQTIVELTPAKVLKYLGKAAEYVLKWGTKACFAERTPVLTKEGYKYIENIKVGDFVLSRDEFNCTGMIAPKMVLKTLIHESRILKLIVEGREILTTGEHPFYVPVRGWVPASELKVNDELLSMNGDYLSVNLVQDINRIEKVYNIMVDQYHTYFVGGSDWNFAVWVHNRKIKSPLPGEKIVKIDIGGEGRNPGAINVNPSETTTTTGGWGRPIPNRVPGKGEKLPFADQSVDVIFLENAPIRPGTISEIQRVLKPGGEVRLVGPNAPEVIEAHKKIANLLGGKVYQIVLPSKNDVGGSLYTNIITVK
ncbi:methyltransferase domain-containing protein [Telmatocola sphagniphila]|uniref:Methyltransferase domain-containing protein n=1 Tax=Telmatocola sphagniphila TaxID=1123043 RepID=A0A8E6EW91_9BACT|nr:methyltransferase domain-containing protein [Telmatocola sphagniphila]